MKEIAWFSGGVTSAVATKISKAKDIRMMDISTHHRDTYRFISDCERWFGAEVKMIRSSDYKDQFEVIEKQRFINSPVGAACTKKLKRELREAGGIQIFGFHYGEKNRIDRIQYTEPETKFIFPLVENKLTKEDCISILNKEGIKIPEMYKMGYGNNNCVGCVKGGMGYWNMIRNDFPETFKRMAELEREIGRSCINGVFLDTLEKGRGRAKPVECGVLCLFD